MKCNTCSQMCESSRKSKKIAEKKIALSEMKNFQCALVGNQNSGKTTLFNLLTGMNQKIGNWPGVTIEKKEGIIKEIECNLIDLPGIYSLNTYSSEEKITSNYILEKQPNIIINIIDATCLERSLYLTMQLLELDIPIIIALNMTDVLKKKGIKIDIKKLEQELGIKVCEISALKQTGIDNLIEAIEIQKRNENIEKNKTQKEIIDNIYKTELKNKIKQEERKIKNKKNRRYITIKRLEMNERLEEEIATQKYEYISNIVKKCLRKKKKWINYSDILDRIFLSKIWSIPIFVIIMFGIYFFSVGIVGKYTIDAVNKIIIEISNLILNMLENIGTGEILKSLIIDGILKGIGSVLSFIPQLAMLFLCISILETSGYMSRIAFLLDKMFCKLGLSGKALIPFIIGTGCSVPGIMSTKIIENEDERKMTSILVPFIPCSAKLPIIALFSGYFFKEYQGLISCSLYFLSIIIIIISAKIMKKYVFKNTSTTFISELPEYKMPNIEYVIREVFEKTFSFIKRAGTIILLASIVNWFLLSFSINFKYGVSIDESILAIIGKKISWIFYPIVGTNSWEVAVSSIQGLIAKEQVVSSMAIISGLEGNAPMYEFLTPISAYTFVIFNLFSAPCFAAIACMKKELGGTIKMLEAILYQTILAWGLASFIQIAIAFFCEI